MQLNKKTVLHIAEQKNEPGWMIDFRLKALDIFQNMPMPTWGADISGLNLDDLCFYRKPAEKKWDSWDDVPQKIKQTFEKLGIPHAERTCLAGVGAQYESELVYKKLKQEWVEQGVVFCDISDGLRNHPELFKNYFATVVRPDDNKFAALNSSVWSGGSFLFVPSGVQVTLPLQAYFRINSARMGQFERTLIIAQPGSSVHYVEGCSAPVYGQGALHSAVVELIACAGSCVRYTTIQNWSSDVHNLVTKRAVAHERAVVEWIDGNFGSRTTMKYPCIVLQGEGARGQLISVAVAGEGQQLDAGGKMIHLAPRTRSQIISKSVCKDGGRATYRGLVHVADTSEASRAHVRCDALLLDGLSRADAQPTIRVSCDDVDVGHEASVSSLDEEQLLYIQSRGVRASQARALLVHGFLDAFVKELPMEYAVEINRLVAMEIE